MLLLSLSSVVTCDLMILGSICLQLCLRSLQQALRSSKLQGSPRCMQCWPAIHAVCKQLCHDEGTAKDQHCKQIPPSLCRRIYFASILSCLLFLHPFFHLCLIVSDSRVYIHQPDKKAHDSWVTGFGSKFKTLEDYTTLSDKFTLVKMALMPSGQGCWRRCHLRQI